MHSGPPKKKIMVHHRNSTLAGTNPSRMPTFPVSVAVSSMKMMNNGVPPLVEDEIIMNPNGEIKMGPEGLIMAPSQSSSSQNHEMANNEPNDPMHHYHHQGMGDVEGMVDNIVQQVVAGNEGIDMDIQYDEDLSFQRHINSVLHILTEDDKAIMKFHMQKIILDAKFGQGFAKNELKNDEMMGIVEPQVEIGVDHGAKKIRFSSCNNYCLCSIPPRKNHIPPHKFH